MSKFSAKLRRLMEERDMNASQLARALYGTIVETRYDRNGNPYQTEVPARRSAVSMWVKGQRTPNPQARIELARHFGVPLAELSDDMGGLHVSAPDAEGMVDLEVNLRVPAHVARTVAHILEDFVR